jgi:hypothetical protein
MEVGAMGTSVLLGFEDANGELATSSLIKSGSSLSDVERSFSEFAQKMGGVNPYAQFSVSSPEPWM